MKTLDEHIVDVRRERDERIEREIAEEAAARVRADEEWVRISKVNHEVGLGPYADPREVARRHNQWQADFFSGFVNKSPSTAVARLHALAAELSVSLEEPVPPEQHAIFAELRRRKHPMLGRPLWLQERAA